MDLQNNFNAQMKRMLSPKNITAIQVYFQRRKNRTFAGDLFFDSEKKVFVFNYDKDFLYSRGAIPVGIELPLLQQHYESKELFETFKDRIPSRENAAYKDYCERTGISEHESDPIILLGTIGRKGPSSFIYEPVYGKALTGERVKNFREKLGLSLREFTSLFQVPLATLRYIEQGRSSNSPHLKILDLYISFPELAEFELFRHPGILSDERKVAVLEKLRKS